MSACFRFVPARADLTTALAAALAACGILAGCGPAAGAAKSNNCIESAPERIQAARARKAVVESLFASFGTIVQESKADVYPAVEAHVTRLYVEEGRRVAAGDKLAELDREKLLISKTQTLAEISCKESLVTLSREKYRESVKSVEARIIAVEKARIELEQRRAELANLNSIYENKKKLKEAGGVSETELDAVKTRYLAGRTGLEQAEHDLAIQSIGFRDKDLAEAGQKPPDDRAARGAALIALNTRLAAAELAVAEAELGAARSSLQQIELLLRETTVRAPIAGVIGKRYLDLGEKARPDAPLFTLFNTDSVYVQVEVSEDKLPSLCEGQPAAVEAAEAAATGKVALIAPFVDPQSRTGRVRITLANAERRFLPGMFVRVEVRTGAPRELLVLPESAVLGGAQPVAFLIRDGTLFRTALKLGKSSDQGLVVLDGLAEGDRVAMHATEVLRDGMAVEAVE